MVTDFNLFTVECTAQIGGPSRVANTLRDGPPPLGAKEAKARVASRSRAPNRDTIAKVHDLRSHNGEKWEYIAALCQTSVRTAERYDELAARTCPRCKRQAAGV